MYILQRKEIKKKTYYNAFIPNINVNTFFTGRSTVYKPQILRSLYKSSKLNIFMENDFKKNNKLIMNVNLDTVQALKSFTATGNFLQRQIITLAVTISIVILSWFIFPSKTKWIAILLSTIFGSLFFFSTKKTSYIKNNNLENELIAYIESNNLDKTEIEKIGEKYRITKDKLQEEAENVYELYLNKYLNASSIQLDEISKLIKIKETFMLSPQNIGNIHYSLAKLLYKNYIITLEQENTQKSSSVINKFLYMSQRILSFDTERGYYYESDRLIKIFVFTREKFNSICADIAKDQYKFHFLFIMNNNVYNMSALKKLKTLTGIDNDIIEKIHNEYIIQNISNTVSLSKKFSYYDELYLNKISTFLNFDKSVSQQVKFQTIASLASHIISCYITNENKQNNIEHIVMEITNLQKRFAISESSLIDLYCCSIENLVNGIISEIVNNLKNKDNFDILVKTEKMIHLVETTHNIFKFLFKDSVSDERFSKIFNNIISKFKPEIIISVYQFYVEISLKEELKLTSTKNANFEKLQKILKISDIEKNILYINVVKPLIGEKINLMCNQEFNKNVQNDANEFISSFNLSEKSILDIKTASYKKFITSIKDISISTIATDLKKANNFRKNLSLEWNDIQKFNDSISAPIYRKTLYEFMGASGIISFDNWQKLDFLRKKIQLSETTAREIFYELAKKKLKTLFEQIITENAQKNQNNEGKQPQKTALGIEVDGSSGNSLFNIIDFYLRNKIYIEDEYSKCTPIESSIKGLTSRIERKTTEAINVQYQYPIDLNGLTEKKNITEIYRQYLVECFSVKSQNEKRKFFNNLDKLSPILGLSIKETRDIHSSVGSLIYKRYLSQALSKGFLNTSEMDFLTNIKNTLSMNTNECLELIKDAKKAKIASLVESILLNTKLDPKRVSDARKMAEQLEVRFREDLEISHEQCLKMFRSEIEYLIENKIITSVNQNELKKVQSDYGLSEETSSKILLEIVKQKNEGFLINAAASLRQDMKKEAVGEMDKIIIFGNLFPIKVNTPSVSHKEKMMLFSLYESYNTQEEAKKALLKIIFEIS